MVNKAERIQKAFDSEYKIGFRKTVYMHIYLYSSYIQCTGLLDFKSPAVTFDIKYDKIVSVDITTLNDKKSLLLRFRSINYYDQNRKTELYVLGLDDFEECKKLILHYKDMYLFNERQKLQMELERQEKQKQIELDAKEFYDKCYSFHIKEDTPVFQVYGEPNQAVLIFVDKNKALNFLKIDGYQEDEDLGIIPYEAIHYYEKAGNVHYVSEVNGNYSSFGGSLTGATFSKKATLFHGLMFGPLGMATAALMSYKPAEHKAAETHFDLSSETKRIDERNVILNYYSEDKKQYVDIELPQDIFNFLQTHIPDKRYSIVNELEKRVAVQSVSGNKNLLDAPKSTPELPEKKQKLTIEEFKEKVEKLKIMYDAGMLTESEYESAKKELLSNI